jgi:hypothetical protein
MRLGIALLLAPVCAGALAASPAATHPFLSERSGRSGVVLHGRLSPGDVDRFSFRLRAGEILSASLLDGEDGEFHDPVLGVFGPGDSTPAARSDDGGPGFLPRLALRADRDGLWTVAVTGFGDADFDGSGHEERLRYRLVVAAQGDPPQRSEHEGNDTAQDADRVRLVFGAAAISGRIERGDVDVFEVWLLGRSTLTASVYDAESGAFHDAVLRLRDRSGALLAENDDGGPGFLSNLSFEPPRGSRGFRPFPVYLELSGFDPDPKDDRPHPEDFRYEFVVSVDPFPTP